MGKYDQTKGQPGQQAKKAKEAKEAKERLTGDRERNKLREDGEQMGQGMPADRAREAEERMRNRGQNRDSDHDLIPEGEERWDS
jgi:hypothetical protein